MDNVISVKHVPALIKWVANEINPGVNFDIGSGKYDLAGEYMRDKGIRYYPFDPHFLPDNVNERTICTALGTTFEEEVTITVANVLCTIPTPFQRDGLLRLISSIASPGYKVFFSVYEGDKTGIGKRSLRNTWQENRRTVTYIKQIEPFFSSVKRLKRNMLVAENFLT